MRQLAGHCAKILLCLTVAIFCPCLVTQARAQETTIKARGFGQMHFEHVETKSNGETETFDLFEPSFGLSLVGALFSPRFMTYDLGVAYLKSDLNGSEEDLDLSDINYNGFLTFFPGRRLSIDLYGRKFRDELENNLFLLNRIRFEELGARLNVLEGERLPSLLVGYLQRDTKTDSEFAGFDETSNEWTVALDKRKSELAYHLGFLHTEFESNDFGYKVKSDIADFYAGKFLTKNLFTDVYADFIRTKTERGGPSVRITNVPVGPPGTSQSVLRSSDREDKELRAGFGLHYQADRFEGDGEYEIRRFEEEFFSRTEQVATVSLAYLPSAETTVATDYSLLLSNGDLADTFDQRIVARVSHRARPNLVFFVEGDNEINRENSGGLASSVARDFNVSDLTVGVDYNRPIGDWLAVTSLALGAGYASVSPGDSGARSDIDASAGLGGTVFRRINLDFNAAYEDHNDNSTFSLDEQVIRGQVVATSNLGNRLQLRGFALAMNFKENGNRFISGLASTRRRLDLEISQYAAEIGFSYLMARNVYGSLAVGRTSHTSRTLETSGNRNKLESDNNYLAASLNVQPIRNLRLVAIGRFQRGTQPRDLDETQDYLDLQAIYRLRSWEVLLGYTRNKIDIGFTDLEQNRTFLTVRRNFEWRIR